jgi:hypothetical protein
MLETFTQTTFAAHLGTHFHLTLTDGPGLSLELLDVTPWQPQTGDTVQAPRRAPFSVLFRGPMTPILPQRIYTLEHLHLGTFELFLVPIGPDQSGMRYEAVFG